MISAIVTTYKREPEMVKRAINSILAQTHKDFELIVVDDSPSDYNLRNDVKEMVNGVEYDRIKYIQHKKNKGGCAARNTGIENAKGEYIAFLDDDDIWLPNKLEVQLGKFSDLEVGLVYCNYNVINTKTNKTVVTNNNYLSNGNIAEKLLINNTMGIFPMVRKSCLESCGLFDTTLQSSQDLDMWLRILDKYKAEYANEVLASCFIHDGEQVSTNPYKKLQASIEINNRFEELLKNNSKLHGTRILQLAQFHSMAGNVKKAISFWFKAVRICPYNVYYNLKYIASMVKHYNK